jgi:hypothetical protein
MEKVTNGNRSSILASDGDFGPVIVTQAFSGDTCPNPDPEALKQQLQEKFGDRLDTLNRVNGEIETAIRAARATGGRPDLGFIRSLAAPAAQIAIDIIAYIDGKRKECGDCEDCRRIMKSTFEDLYQAATGIKTFNDPNLIETSSPAPLINAEEAAAVILLLLALKKLVGALLIPTPFAPAGAGLLLTP